MRRYFSIGPAILLLMAQTAVQADTLKLAYLMKQCDQKMVVMANDENGRIIRAGEKIDSYCRGALEGIFSMLARTKAVCLEDEYPSPDYLLSVLKTYQATPGGKSDDATEIAEAAFKRAFACK